MYILIKNMEKKDKFIIIISIIGEVLYILPVIFLEIITIKYNNKAHIFWCLLKMETLKDIISKNYPILHFTKDFNKIYVYRNYRDLLKNSTKDECGNGPKKCGILDTSGNIVCLENYLSCPINEIIMIIKIKKINLKIWDFIQLS